MTGDIEPDRGGPKNDALDRAIDEAIRAELRGGPGDLRARVLARLDEPVEDRPSRWSFVLRPALLPAAGVLLIVAGVAISWWRVDQQLSLAGRGQARATVAGAARPLPSPGSAAARGPSSLPARAEPGAASPAPTATTASAGDSRRQSPGGDRVFAASLLAMDAARRPKGVAADATVTPDEEPDPFLPGAPGWNLGEPIKPIPRPRPVAIPPLVAAPVVVAPIVDAPPVSTLATPVSTLSTDNSSRDQTGPGKSGGVRP